MNDQDRLEQLQAGAKAAGSEYVTIKTADLLWLIEQAEPKTQGGKTRTKTPPDTKTETRESSS